MEIINLSKKKFSSLSTLDFGNVINTEAVLYCFDYKGKKRVFKNLHRLKGSIFANKLFTLEMLDDNKELLPKSFVVPNYLTTVNGTIMGCAEDYIEGINLQVFLNYNKIDIKEHIHYLQEIGGLLEQLKYIRKDTALKSIYINDLHAGNFIVTPNDELKVVDIDSVKICDNKPFPSKYLSSKALLNYSNKYKIFDKGDENNKEYEYRKELGYVDADENSDLYCYIMTILSYLYKGDVNKMSIDEFYKYLNYLNFINFSHELIDSFEKIILNCDNINPKDYLSELTIDKVGRSNEKVFKLVTSKSKK